MGEERRSDQNLSEERAADLVAGAETILTAGRKPSFCEIRKDDTVDDLRGLLAKAYEMGKLADTQAAAESGRDRMATQEWDERTSQMLEHITEIHAGLRPSVPMIKQIRGWLTSFVG